MKKIVLTAALLFCAFMTIYAQEDSISKKHDGHFIIGNRFGASINDMSYSSSDLNIYNHHPLISFQPGFYFGYNNIVGGLSIRNDLLYSTRGVNLTWGDINYKLTSHYIDLRMPISYNFLRDKAVQPYVMLAPCLSFVTHGNITYVSDYTYSTTPLTKANFTAVDLSLLFGGGIKFPMHMGAFQLILGMEFGYNFGLMNTFSKMELNNEAEALNLPMYEVNGTRKNRNFETAFTVTIPFTFKKPTPRPKIEEVVVEEEVPKPVSIEYETKDCYSVEEIKAFLKLGIPIEDKRVCIFDLKFEFGSAVLKKKSEKMLDELVSLFQQLPEMTFQITGHTDNIGTDEYNQKLSEDRAMSVYKYFLKKGIPADHMTTKGFGSKYPIDTNDTDAGRAKNRRVEIDIITSALN